MPKQIDFVVSNYQNHQKIIRPTSSSQQQNHINKKSSIKTIQILKSFQPAEKINEHIAPQLRSLKQFQNKKREQQKKLKKMFAQGIIQKEQLEQIKSKTTKKQQINKEQPQKVKVDEAGQLRDQKGNLLFIKNQTSELSINKRIAQNLKLKDINKKQQIKYHQKLGRPFFDRNLALMTGSRRRIKRSRLGFQFLQKGSYQPVSVLSSNVKIQEIQNLSDVFKQSTEDFKKITKKRNRTTLNYDREAPLIEWWDNNLLHNAVSYQAIIEDSGIKSEDQNWQQKINEIKIQNYLNIFEFSDDVRIQKVGDQTSKDQNIIMPMYLTKDQKKKLKRKKKKQKLIEKNDMIRLGLIQPEKPKLRVGNMAIVMKNQFILDPSKVQEQARKQQQERLAKHLQANSDRKLTKKQKQSKHIRKLKRDSAKQCRRVVFKIFKLDNNSHIFKVNMNAKQLALNGFVIKPKDYHQQIVMVAIEGGSKAVKFYKNLMLNRIKWEEDNGNKCVLVWQGAVQNTTLGKWRIYEVGDESETIKILKQKGVQFLWDYVAN